MGALQCAHRPPSAIQLTTGMLWIALIGVAHDGHAEGGVKRLYVVRGGGSRPSSAAHSSRQPASIIFGSRWITTLSSEPTHSPSRATVATRIAGERWRTSMNSTLLFVVQT